MTMTWLEEVQAIAAAAAKYNVDPLLIMAIRRAEHGGPGREFGVVSEPAPSYALQLAVCCESVRNALTGYPGNPLCRSVRTTLISRVIYTTAFLSYFTDRYCPINADNDPTNLNRNYSHNVRAIYHDLISLGPTDPHWSDTWDSVS